MNELHQNKSIINEWILIHEWMHEFKYFNDTVKTYYSSPNI